MEVSICASYCMRTRSILVCLRLLPEDLDEVWVGFIDEGLFSEMALFWRPLMPVTQLEVGGHMLWRRIGTLFVSIGCGRRPRVRIICVGDRR